MRRGLSATPQLLYLRPLLSQVWRACSPLRNARSRRPGLCSPETPALVQTLVFLGEILCPLARVSGGARNLSVTCSWDPATPQPAPVGTISGTVLPNRPASRGPSPTGLLPPQLPQHAVCLLVTVTLPLSLLRLKRIFSRFCPLHASFCWRSGSQFPAHSLHPAVPHDC